MGQEFSKNINSLSDENLLHILALLEHQYSMETLDIIKKLFTKRGFDDKDLVEYRKQKLSDSQLTVNCSSCKEVIDIKGEELWKGSFNCPSCQKEQKIIYDFQKKKTKSKDEKLTGLGGWLILIGIGLFAAVLHLLISLSDSIYKQDLVSVLKQLTLLTICIVFLITYFSKSKIFPNLMIFGYIIRFLFTLIFLIASKFDVRFLLQLFLDLIIASIWIPYFLVSKRVKLTFVNPLFGKSKKEPITKIEKI